MAIYVNSGFLDPDGGKEWKHLDASCPRLSERAAAGYAIRRVPNIDRARSGADSIRRRCPICFTDGPALPSQQQPSWLLEAKRTQDTRPAVAWTYDLMWPQRKSAQVGMATNLHERLASRWRGTCNGRLGGHDSIPWLYDALRDGCGDEVVLEVAGYDSRQEAHAAERELRDQKRAQGWQVSSDR